MNVVEWFDPSNIDHIKAYRHLMKYGVWPMGFIPDDMDYPPSASIAISMKIAEHYVIKEVGDTDMVTCETCQHEDDYTFCSKCVSFSNYEVRKGVK